MTRPPTEAAQIESPGLSTRARSSRNSHPLEGSLGNDGGDSWLNIGHLTLTIVNTATLSTLAIQAGEAHADPMPLSGRLPDVVLSRPCPHCGHVLDKKGSWFHHVSLYQCGSCHKQVPMTYDAKVELLEQYRCR